MRKDQSKDEEKWERCYLFILPSLQKWMEVKRSISSIAHVSSFLFILSVPTSHKPLVTYTLEERGVYTMRKVDRTVAVVTDARLGIDLALANSCSRGSLLISLNQKRKLPS